MFLPLLTGFGPVGFIESDAARSVVTAPVARSIATSGAPSVQTRAGILIDATSGETLWERDADRRLPVASTTKIMTALVAIERGRLAQPVVVRIGAAGLPGNSVAGLRAGDSLPLGEMLYGLMLPSGNDAALAIAEAVGASTDGFVGLMNRRAEELGLTNTHFANPHGVDAPNHFSSARDLATLARFALQNPTFAEVVSTKQHGARGQFTYSWANLNRMLFLRADATGVKTGTTDGAGESLVASARQGERSTVSVVLNASDRWTAGSALLDHFFKGFSRLSLVAPASPFFRGVKLATTRTMTVPAWQSDLLSTEPRVGEGGALALDFELAGRPLERVAGSRS